MLDNYREPEELLSDESFLAWYHKTGEGQDAAWLQWMAANPGSKELVEQALTLLKSTRLPEKEVPASQIDRAEAALLQKIAALESFDGTEKDFTDEDTFQEPADTADSRIVPLHRGRRWIAAACIIVALSASLVIARTLRSARLEVKTAYGQISPQQLPDGTEVTMNANSRLSYSAGWKDGSDREVWVKGEAFFHVARTPLKSRFIVHTDHLDIIVTGTRFNVVNRHGKDNVLLQEGSVILHIRGSNDLTMTPGDFVEFNSDQLEKRTAKNDSILAWKEQKLVFDRTPLRELVTIINDQYGIPVKLATEPLGDSTISAILPNNNLNILLRSLEATNEFDVVRQDGTILIKAHSQQN